MSLGHVRRLFAPLFALAILAAVIAPMAAFAGAADSAGAEREHSYAGPESGESVRQCMPDRATCDDLPAASVAAVLSLNGDVIAAVASDSWERLIETPAPKTREVRPVTPTDPPRSIS